VPAGLKKYVVLLSITICSVFFLLGLIPGNGDTGGPEQNDRNKYEKKEISSSIFEIGEKRQKPVNVLLLGLDDDKVRSDVIILVNYSPDSGKLNLLSLERDTRVSYKGKRMKLNAVYAAGGIEGIKEKVFDITGIKADYYAVFDFKSFRDVIDVLGGVYFEVPFNMKYDDPTQNLHIDLKKGMQLLDGKKAEQLVRYRKGNKKGSGYTEGDIGRIKMQQEFIKALIEQKANIKYLSKIDDIYYILKKQVKTNIDMDFITKYSTGLTRINMDNVKAYALPGKSALISNVWYFIHDKEETKKLINSFYK